MAFGTLDNQDDNEPLADINMVPFIDVMLVLLIIFIVTAPLLTHAIKVDLPKAPSALVTTHKVTPVEISIDAHGQFFWDNRAIDNATLGTRLQSIAQEHRETEIHIRADRLTPYEAVAKVIAAATQADLRKIGFVTDPR